MFVIVLLGVRSLANASRARQFNPLNPPGVGWVPLPQTNMAAVVGRARSCAVVRGRARSCVVVRGRSCAWSVMRGRAWSVVRGRARSCAVVRAWSVIRGRSFVIVRGRSCVVVRSCRSAREPRAARFAASTAVARTNERTTYNNPLNPPGVGWVNFFYLYKVRVSIRTCVPNLGSFRRPCRKFCLSNL